jgi:hypothetical protein
MCDYSLMMMDSRLAAEGDRLVAHRFKNGSVGLVSCADFNRWQAARPTRWWDRLKNCFSSQSESGPVVCIPPGALLRAEGIPPALCRQFGLAACENAIFTQLSAEVNHHRDALLFCNAAPLLLQLLPEGQSLRVVRLTSAGNEQHTLEETRTGAGG